MANQKINFKTRVLLGYEYFQHPQIKLEKHIFGSEYGGHCVALGQLDQNSVGFSRLGLDITFDEQLINKYGLEIQHL